MKKKMMSVLLTAALAASLAACGGSQTAETTAAASEEATAAEDAGETVEEAKEATGELPDFTGEELSVSTFAFNAELLQKNIYDPFMEATGCKLIVEGASNAQRVTKIKESPSDYDVVVIGDAFVADLIDEGLIEKIDSSQLTNLEYLYDRAKAPFGEDYGPAYTFNRLGIVYDASTCPIEITSWEDLWDPELEGQISIPDITTTSGPLFYYSIAETKGLTPGTDDDAIFEMLAELKPNIVKTYTSANDTITMLNQGEISVAVLLDYSYTSARSASEDYIWVEPPVGLYSGFNTLNIIKGSQHKDLAMAFIDYYISKDVQLAEALDGVDSPVRTDVELTPEQSANFTYGEEMIERMSIPDWSVINENKADWTNRWNELFSVQ